MSYEAMTWAAKVLEQHPFLETGPRFVLLMMANRADEEGELYPSVRWIMVRTKYSERSVRGYVRELLELGLMTKESRQREDGGQSSNIYRLSMSQYVLRLHPPGAPSAGGVATVAPGGAAGAGEGVQQVQGPGASGAPLETKEEKKESSKPICPLNADLFEKAMLQLPKREGNNPARDAIAAWNSRIRSKVDPVSMVDGARRYRAYCEAKGIVGTDKVQMAKTFFGPGKPFEQDWAVAPAQKKTGAPWFRSASGINEKARDRGFEIPSDPRAWQALKAKVYEAEGVTTEMLRTAQVDHA